MYQFYEENNVEIYNNTTKQFCNNCGKQGHIYSQCKLPITSIGIITFRINNGEIEYLMICRKHTLGFIDFMRGKYSVYNKDYIMNMFKQMTQEEKKMLKIKSFAELWNGIWGGDTISIQYKMEENVSSEKFKALTIGISSKYEFYNLSSMIDESNKYGFWVEPEWGFPKGRRNYQENDYECAIREFTEETGYDNRYLKKVNNILPFEEIFTGSNYKSYKHKYFLAYIDFDVTLKRRDFECSEVSKTEWKKFDECMNSIREYNLEKKKLMNNIDTLLKKYTVDFIRKE